MSFAGNLIVESVSQRSGKTIYIIMEKERQTNKLVGSSNTKI